MFFIGSTPDIGPANFTCVYPIGKSRKCALEMYDHEGDVDM